MPFPLKQEHEDGKIKRQDNEKIEIIALNKARTLNFICIFLHKMDVLREKAKVDKHEALRHNKAVIKIARTRRFYANCIAGHPILRVFG